jgi:hypothetical protein
MKDDELNPNEREALEALPRERQAPRPLEERVVNALRREGLVRTPGAARPPWWSVRLAFAPAMAAGLLLFAGGVLLGARLAPPAAAPAGAGADRATRIEQSGAHYLDALAALSRSSDTAQSVERSRGRQAAGRVLRQAAQEVVRLDPNDALAARILGRPDAADAQLASNDATHIVWN